MSGWGLVHTLVRSQDKMIWVGNGAAVTCLYCPPAFKGEHSDGRRTQRKRHVFSGNKSNMTSREQGLRKAPSVVMVMLKMVVRAVGLD